MNETDRPKLDYRKTEIDPWALDYRRGLRKAAEFYQLPDSAFRHDRYEVILSAVRLLSGYDIDPVFLDDPERNLFALAIADTWLATDEIREKKALLDILKLVATGVTKEKQYQTLSGKVQMWSYHESPRGTEFDPMAERGSTHREYIAELRKYIAKHHDAKLTKEAVAILDDWGENSVLHHVREKLAVTPQNENQGEVAVLDLHWEKMQNDIGVAAFRLSERGEQVIVFNRDYLRSIEHEYAHSQSTGLVTGYMDLLFRGLTEALTEYATSEPETYLEQRLFLRRLLKERPEYEYLLYEAYVGNPTARRDLFSRIAADYGLIGYLIMARVSPEDIPQMSGRVGQSIYIHPLEASNALAEKEPYRSVAAKRKKMMARLTRIFGK